MDGVRNWGYEPVSFHDISYHTSDVRTNKMVRESDCVLTRAEARSYDVLLAVAPPTTLQATVGHRP